LFLNETRSSSFRVVFTPFFRNGTTTTKKKEGQQKSSSCFPPLFVLFFRLLLTFCIPQIKEREREREKKKKEERREKREKGAEFFSLSLLLSFSGRRTKGRNPPMAPKERTKDPRKKKIASHLSC